MQTSQEHFTTIVYAKFGGQTEWIVGNWKIENRPFAGSGDMVRNKLYWDANNPVELPKQRNLYQSNPTFLCFESPIV